MLHPEDIQFAQSMIEEAIKDRAPLDSEYRVVLPTGEVRWINSKGSTVYDEKGDAVRMSGICIDITKSRGIREQLRESREDFARAQTVAQIGSWRLNMQHNILTWSDENYRIFGLPMGTPLTYETFLGCIHPDDRQYVDAQWQAGMRGEPYDIEHRLIVDGEVRWVREKAYLEFDAAGVLLGGFGISQDITDRKRNENALRQNEVELRKLNRALKALSDLDKVMLRASNEADYLNEVCKIIVENFGYVMVWVGFSENDEVKTVRPVAQAGFGEGYLKIVNINWADTEHGRGPTGMAIRTGEFCVCRNMLTDPKMEPWREEAIKRGYASSIALPLIESNSTLGAITIYSKEPDPFLEKEVQLLSELANDIAYGISIIRLRAKHAKDEESLAAAHRQIQNIIDNATAIVYAFDLEGRFVLANAAIAQLLNSTPDQMIGKRRSDFMPQADADWHEANDRKVIEAGRTLDFEEQSKFPGCSITWLTTKFPLRDVAGKIYAVGGISTDITARKHAEEVLAESEKRMQIALRVSHSFAFEWDPVSDRVVRSESCGPVLGLSAEEAQTDTGRKYFLRVHPDDRERFVNTLKALKPGMNNYLVEYRIVRGDGALAVLEESGEASFDGDAKFTRLVGTSTDITIRKEAEEILKRDEETLKILVKEQAHDLAVTQIELERAKRLADIGVLASTVAHELRNPLAAVGLSAYHIKKMIKDPRIQEDLSTIDKRISEADQIINNVLSYSKIKTVRFQPVKINGVLQECIDEVTGRFPGQATAVNVKTDPSEGIFIEADYLQMKEVFSNVLNNAFDALNKDGGIINIESRVNDSGVAIMIKDNGEGIDKENLEKVFAPFFTTKTTGTGLGLAVCHRLVMLHAGSITVESDKGKGTMVKIILPIRAGGAVDAKRNPDSR